jgi:hypothetical protein
VLDSILSECDYHRRLLQDLRLGHSQRGSNVLRPDDNMDCVIHKSAKKVVSSDNKFIEPEIPDESADITVLRDRQEGENNTRLLKAIQIRKFDRGFGRADRGGRSKTVPIAGAPDP